MTRNDDVLQSILSPVRDLYLARVLEEIVAASHQNYDCDTDTERREQDGSLSRFGVLHLPQRHDIRARRERRTVYYDVVDGQMMRFDTFTYKARLGGEAVISPFQWNDLSVLFRLDGMPPNWLALRRWYLESFQARFDESSPDFRGTVHSMSGPDKGLDGRWRLRIDLGSAPVEVVHDLVDMLTGMGARQVELTSERPDIATVDPVPQN